MLLMLASEAVIEAPAPRGVFEGLERRATKGLAHTTFLSPGIAFVGWSSLLEQPRSEQRSTRGVAFELSLSHWLTSEFFIGTAVQVERLNRWRSALSFFTGLEVLGLELGMAREFAAPPELQAQWAFQIGPYVSLGAVYAQVRWTLALGANERSEIPVYPRSGTMFLLGLKLPLLIRAPK